MKRKYIYTYQCFEELTHIGVMKDVCRVDVYANSEKEALKSVKELIKKKEYQLDGVSEYFVPSEDRPLFSILVQCHNRMDPEAGSLQDNINVVLWADNPAEAVERAKTLISRKFYRVSSIVQKLHDEQ